MLVSCVRHMYLLEGEYIFLIVSISEALVSATKRLAVQRPPHRANDMLFIWKQWHVPYQ